MLTKAPWQQILIGPWEQPKRWSPKQSMEERHVHNGEMGNRETPSHRHKPTINSGPGIAKLREVEGMASSQPLLVPEE